MPDQNNPKGMIKKEIRSVLPLYLCGATWVLGALLFPIYKLWALALTAALSGAVYIAGARLIPKKVVWVKAPEMPFATGEAATDTMLEQVKRDLQALHTLNVRIPDDALSQNITRMEIAGAGILEQVAKSPRKAREIRKFATYYLPTAVKVLTTYASLDESGAGGANAANLMHDVERNAATIACAFEAQLDALFSGEVLDVSSDLHVLQNMFTGDGLAASSDGQTQTSASTAQPPSPQLRL